MARRRIDLVAPRLSRAEHLDRLSDIWEPGQHVSIFAPTGGGKSHLVRHGLVPLWPEGYPVLVIDAKGDDPTLAGWGNPVEKMPPRYRRQWSRHGQIWRLKVPESVEALDEAKERVRYALRTARREKGWVIVLNEVRALTDAKSPALGLSPYVEQLWLRGRPHVTVIGETQRPAWVPGSMYDQPTHLYIGKIQDERSRKRLREIGGDTELIEAAMQQLERREFVHVDRDSGEVEIVEAK